MVKVTAKRPPVFHHRKMLDFLKQKAKEEFGSQMLRSAQYTTRSWKHDKPDWVIRYVVNQYRVIVKIVPSDPEGLGYKKWNWIDKGTEGPYEIPSAGNERREDGTLRTLKFQPGYSAGSTPGTLRVKRSRRSGPEVYARKVMHPGIAARGWSDKMYENWSKSYRRWMKPVMKEAARISGHGGK